MRKMLRNRRGSVAFATVIALIPLIGAIALGAEAGSWYVTKQRAQNAADAAAYSGGLRLACTLAAGNTGVTCGDTQTVDYRGKQFAAQNAFCNAGDTSYPGSTCPTLSTGTTQSVQIDQPGSNQVRATVSQTQPAYLAALLGLSTVTIGASAVAQVDQPSANPCILSLKDPLGFQGSVNVSSKGCSIASDNDTTTGINFTGNNGIQLNAPTYTVGGCFQTNNSGTQCDSVQTYQQKVPDPLSALNTAVAALKLTDFPKGPCSGSTAVPYETGQCYNAGNPAFPTPLSGTYYFSGNVKINGSPTITSGSNPAIGTNGATLIFFGGATLTITGTPTIQLTAVTHDIPTPPAPIPATGPSVLAPVMSLMTGLLIYDGEAYSKKGVNISGTSASYFNGMVYVPNAPVTYAGNSGSSAPFPGCYQVIAYGVTFQGNPTLDNSGCPSGAPILKVQTVRLVQ
jgi:hypothetical protein